MDISTLYRHRNTTPHYVIIAWVFPFPCPFQFSVTCFSMRPSKRVLYTLHMYDDYVRIYLLEVLHIIIRTKKLRNLVIYESMTCINSISPSLHGNGYSVMIAVDSRATPLHSLYANVWPGRLILIPKETATTKCRLTVSHHQWITTPKPESETLASSAPSYHILRRVHSPTLVYLWPH